MNQSYLRGIYLRLAGVLMLVVVLALAASAYLSHKTFERALAPQMSMKVATVGATVRSLVLKAVDNGIKFHELYGIDQKFEDVKEDNPEISYLAITDTSGKVLHQRLKAPAGAEAHFRSAPVLARLSAVEQQQQPIVRLGDQYIVTVPIVSAEGPLGLLHIGVGVGFVDSIVMDMLLDVLVVLVVALFFTLELLNFMAGARLEAALRTLGDTLERGTQGNFTTPHTAAPAHEFTAVHSLLEAVLARVNSGYQALTREVDAGRHGPAHERLPGLHTVQQGLAALAQKFRFGVDDAPRGASDTELNKVRAPLFIFILAEELTRSFLPSYVNQLQVAIPGLSPALVVGLPIALFMLIVALGQPFIGAWSERVGHRHAMRVGSAIAALGFLATAFAYNVLDLLLWRSLCAVGYAMVFVAAQGYVLTHSVAGNRARSFSLFIGAIMVATVCGPSIGGILADNIGARPTFAIAAVLALVALGVMHTLPAMQRKPAAAAAHHKVPTLKEIGSLMASLRFMAVTGLAAVPAKIVLTGMLFYLVPMYMLSVGANQAMTGRILMVYAVMMVLMGPLAAAWASTRQRMEWLVGGGLVLSGAGGMVMLAGADVSWVFAAVVLVGAGQAMSMAAQSALVSERCPEDVQRLGEHTVYGVYRLLERLGNAAGPLIAGGLVLFCGYRNSFVVIGGMAVLCGLLFTLSARRALRPALVPA
jgi:MFS family permease